MMAEFLQPEFEYQWPEFRSWTKLFTFHIMLIYVFGKGMNQSFLTTPNYG